MKNTMKKILCTMLVVVLCLTSAPFGGFDFTVEAADYQVGDIIQFGSYPQSKVTDEALIAELNALSPAWDDWTSYGYYSGNGDFGSVKPGVLVSMAPGDWMRYTDIIYNGTKYRGVKFTQYRPMVTDCAPSAANSLQDEMGYFTNEIYWFKFESISWQILDPDTGFVVSKTLLDCQPYSNTFYLNPNASSTGTASFNDPAYTNFANNYETSSIRKWLNKDFYNTAFSDSEKKKINTTTIKNDGYITINGYNDILDDYFGGSNTSEKIFLLGWDETADRSFLSGSDYANSQGLGADPVFGTMWFFRTAGLGAGYSCIAGGGYIEGDQQAMISPKMSLGIRPALKLVDITNIYNPTPGDPTPDDPKPDKPENTTGIIIDSDIYAVKVNGVETSKIFTILDSNLNFDKVTAWDIVLTVDGVETQPEGKVTVRIPVPVGYNAEKCKVYHIDPETGKLTDMNARVENGYFVFTTDHFSIYSVVELHEHSFGDKDAECSCGFDRTENCSCNCHKGGIAGFFFKIILFFQKLFKMNKECKCGISHY